MKLVVPEKRTREMYTASSTSPNDEKDAENVLYVLVKAFVFEFPHAYEMASR